ncbi:hypothetical protein Natoc_1576 [Natronococcus occultus SP4]|uniref:Uncharacterized protein n=1 Tax=Natronococcus occultus SP4 TaxID=694430 RepID=L0JZU5_9EURY|nr:hypothetical protein Natoc_1576 [Natronococcus occultus SP4]
MSRVAKILIATFAIAVVWKVVLGGTSDVEYEYQPVEE